MGNIRDKPRNAISSDDLIAYLISKGLLIHYTILNVAERDSVRDKQVVCTITLDVPSHVDPGDYTRFSFVGTGPSVGHAHQIIFDQCEMELM